MTLIQYILATIFSLSLVVGQILFKIAADQKTAEGEIYSIFQIIFSLPMISACVLYGLTIILYVHLLQQIPLSRAYLFSIAGSAVIPIIAVLVFKEDFNLRYLIGMILVIAGLTVSTTV